MVRVAPTTDPGSGVLVLAVLAMARPGMSTVVTAVQAGLALPDGQVLPGVADATVFVRVLSPVSGLSTVTEKVIVTVAPTARFPVQARLESAGSRVTVPVVAVASPL